MGGEVLGSQQLPDGVGEHDAFRLAFALVVKEARADLPVGHDVEGIDDVIESQPHSDIRQAALVKVPVVVLAAGVQELASR